MFIILAARGIEHEHETCLLCAVYTVLLLSRIDV